MHLIQFIHFSFIEFPRFAISLKCCIAFLLSNGKDSLSKNNNNNKKARADIRLIESYVLMVVSQTNIVRIGNSKMDFI